MSENHSRLCEILKAGDWNSKAFMDYLNKSKLEREAMSEMIQLDEEEVEDEIELQ